MLKSFRLKNVKGFIDTGDIEIKPLTIFIGDNSSGKSSILRFPVVLKQTFQPNVTAPLLLRGDLVDYGSFEDVVNQNSTKNEFGFFITYKLSKQSYPSFLPDIPKEEVSTEILLSVSDKNRELIIKKANYYFDSELETYSSDSKDFDDFNFRYRHFFPNMIFLKENGDSILDFNLDAAIVDIKKLADSINYIGPFRENPLRKYSYQGKAPVYVGKSGDVASQILFSLFKSENENETERFNRISHWVEKIFGYRLNIKDSYDDFHIELESLNTGKINNLVDVGFGISQLLPILVQSFYQSSNENLTIIEQPELHLHPEAQVGLADLFVEAIKAVDNNYFMIETHSEGFLLRLRRFIVEGKLSKNDIVLYYTEKNIKTGNCEVQKLDIDEITGRIANWPEGFFSQSFNEVRAIEKAATKVFGKNSFLI